ncbi:MAG: dipeptidase [Acidobacteriota bacterium]|nr:dipeptidase [Acidobacteriota bacterium]
MRPGFVQLSLHCLNRVLCASLLIAAVSCSGDDGTIETPEELTTRAQTIHERVLTADTHKDISGNFAPTDGSEGEDPNVQAGRQVDLPQMREGGLDLVFFIVYVGQGQGNLTDEGYTNALGAAKRKFEGIRRMTNELYGDQIGLATSASEAKEIAAEGKLVAAIGIENGYPMGDDIGLIAQFKEWGAGYMGITHNGHNQLGDSNTAGWYGTSEEPQRSMSGGLSELGVEAVAEMNRQGIMIDISHAGKETMLDTLAISQAPVIASHSSATALRDHSRNLDDEQLLALKENGGVMQTVALGNYLKDPGPRNVAIAALREEMGLPARGRGGRGSRGGRGVPTASEQSEPTTEERAAQEALQAEFERRVSEEIDLEFPAANVGDLVDHIDYAVNLIGIDYVGISSDFDGGGGIDGWNNAAETFNVTHELVKRGYTEEEIAKVWSGNLLRVWHEVEQVAQRIQGEESK